MLRKPILVALVLGALTVHAAAPSQTNWKARVTAAMPLLGHRNWILIVDSAYPLQASPGLETVETSAGLPEVLQSVLGIIGKSPHVRPDVFMDAELPFVPESDAPGVSAYRLQIASMLHAYAVEPLPHDRIISNIDEAGKTFHILVLKTNLTIPYTSVFLRLNCRYWSDEAEARLRARMKSAKPQ